MGQHPDRLWPVSVEQFEPRSMLSAILADQFVNLPGLTSEPAVVADLNGDGRPDAIVHDGHQRWVVRLGQADQTFLPGSTLPKIGEIGASAAWTTIIAGRFTTSGKLDLLAVRPLASGGWVVYLLIGDGAGNFIGNRPWAVHSYGANQASAYLDGQNSPAWLVFDGGTGIQGLRFDDSGRRGDMTTLIAGANLVGVADFDGDGRDDLAVQDQSGTAVDISEPSGFDRVFAYRGLPRQSIIVGDADGDHRPDLVVADQTRGKIVLVQNPLAQPGHGIHDGFAVIDLSPGGGGISALGDVNGDGVADLLVYSETTEFPVSEDQLNYYVYRNYSMLLSQPGGGYLGSSWGRDYIGGRHYGPPFVVAGVLWHGYDLFGTGLMSVFSGGARMRLSVPDTFDVHRPVIDSITLTAPGSPSGQRRLVATASGGDRGLGYGLFFNDANNDGIYTENEFESIGPPGKTDLAYREVLELDGDFRYAGTVRFRAFAYDAWGFAGPVSTGVVTLQGGGTFQGTPGSTVSDTLSPSESVVQDDRRLPVAVADFTGDGIPDLIVNPSDGGLYFRRGFGPGPTGAPRFGTPRLILSGAGGLLVARRGVVGRFDGGSALDLVIQRIRPDGGVDALLLANNGTGHFTLRSSTLLTNITDPTFASIGPMAAAYLDGQSSRAWLVVSANYRVDALRFGDDGAVGARRAVATGQEGFASFSPSWDEFPPSIADFDGDGRDDVLLVRGSTPNNKTIQVSLSRGDTFKVVVVGVMSTYVGHENLTSIRVGDVDGDHVPDVVIGVASYGVIPAYGAVRVYHGARTGGVVEFSAPDELYRRTTDQSGNFSVGIRAIGDVLGDGRIQVAADFYSPGVGDVVAIDPAHNGQPTIGHTIVSVGNPHLEPYESIFLVADADGDGVLDVFRRDDGLDVFRFV
jgi:hypothetical protein